MLGATCVLVPRQTQSLNVAKLREVCTQLIFKEAMRKSSDVNNARFFWLLVIRREPLLAFGLF